MNLLRISLIGLLAACSTQEEKKPTAPPQPTVDKAPKARVEASFASVQMLEDCPEPPKPAPGAQAPSQDAPPARAPAKSAPAAPAELGAATHYRRPCMQSTVQLAFRNLGTADATIDIAEVRFLSADGKRLSSLQTRSPTKWQDNSYLPWDGLVPQGGELKASYKISSPDWEAVQAAIGASSYGPMYVLEADIVVGTDSQTIRSAEFTRQRPVVPPT